MDSPHESDSEPFAPLARSPRLRRYVAWAALGLLIVVPSVGAACYFSAPPSTIGGDISLHPTNQSYLRVTSTDRLTFTASTRSAAVFTEPGAANDGSNLYVYVDSTEESSRIAQLAQPFYDGADDAEVDGDPVGVVGSEVLHLTVATHAETWVMRSERSYDVFLANDGPTNYYVWNGIAAANTAAIWVNRQPLVTDARLALSRNERSKLTGGSPLSTATEDHYSRIALSSAGTANIDMRVPYNAACPFNIEHSTVDTAPHAIQLYEPVTYDWTGAVTGVELQGYTGEIHLGEASALVLPDTALRIRMASGFLRITNGSIQLTGEFDELTGVKRELIGDAAGKCAVDESKTASLMPNRWSAFGSYRDLVGIVGGIVVGLLIEPTLRRLFPWWMSSD